MHFPACNRQTKGNFFTQFHSTWDGSVSAALYVTLGLVCGHARALFVLLLIYPAKPCLAIARLNMLIILNANDCDLPGGVGDDAGGGCAGQTRVGGDGEAQHAVQLDLKAK